MRINWRLLLLLALSGCSTNGDLLSAFENRGPLLVTPRNPYVGVNRLLSHEMKLDANFRGFIKEAGMPAAIEIRKDFFQPYRLYLFYPAGDESYLAEQRGANWLITGPERIGPDRRQELERITPKPNASTAGTASTVSADQRTLPRPPTGVSAQFSPRPSQAPSPSHSVPDRTPELENIRRIHERAAMKHRAETQPAAPQTPPPADSKPDVPHVVSFPGETLRLIAEWYTGSADNAGYLAKYNSLRNPNEIYIGQTICIPATIARRAEALPLQEVDRYQSRIYTGRTKSQGESSRP